jgi:hypothetical protein
MSDSSFDSSTDSSLEPTNQPTKRKAQSLEDLLHEFGPIESVSYTPFQPKQHQPAKALLPLTFPTQPHLYDYFTLFFTPDLFCTITTNTNRYANIQRIYAVDKGLRKWSDLLIKELYVFISAIIYIGVHDKLQTCIY